MSLEGLAYGVMNFLGEYVPAEPAHFLANASLKGIRGSIGTLGKMWGRFDPKAQEYIGIGKQLLFGTICYWKLQPLTSWCK